MIARSVCRTIGRSTNGGPLQSKGGGAIPNRSQVLFYNRGLVLITPDQLRLELRPIFFDGETRRTDEATITLIEASEYLNIGWELVGSISKGYAVYTNGTAENILIKAYRYFNVTYSLLYPVGLISLWNARTPTSCPVGHQIVTSAAGPVPNADGTLVDFPVNHPGKGVMIHPAYQNLFPLTAANFSTGWTKSNVAISLVDGWYKVNVIANGSATFALVVGAVNGSNVRQSFKIKKGSGATDGNLFQIRDSTAPVNLIRFAFNYDTGKITYQVGSAGVEATSTGTLGEWDISLTTAWTTGNAISVYCGFFTGDVKNANSHMYVKMPLLVASPYQMPYAPPGASVPSTAATSDGNGLSIPMDTRMTAALSGGAFTIAALVEMGTSSAQVTAPGNVVSANDVVSGLIFADSGGKLKCTDGTNIAEVTVAGGWSRTDELLQVVQCDGAEFRIGYAKNTFSAITWGSAVAVGADGDWDVGTHERVGLNSTIPFGTRQVQNWNIYATDASILTVSGYA